MAVHTALGAFEQAPDRRRRHLALAQTIRAVSAVAGAAERREMVAALGPERAATLARALGFDGVALREMEEGRVFLPRGHEHAVSAMLLAMAEGPVSEGQVAFVGEVVRNACPWTLRIGGAALAAAIAHARHGTSKSGGADAPAEPQTCRDERQSVAGAREDRSHRTEPGHPAEPVHFSSRLRGDGGDASALADASQAAKARQVAEASRLAEIFGSERGRRILASRSLAPQVRRETWALLLQSHRSEGASPPRDLAWLLAQPAHPWLSAEVQSARFQPRASDFLRFRSDAPEVLLGTDLENTIGTALGLTPDEAPKVDAQLVRRSLAHVEALRARREEEAALGLRSYFTSEASSAVVEPIAAALRAVGGGAPSVTVLPVRWASLESGAIDLSLFRVIDAKTGAERFVDHEARTYASFDAWRTENQLPPGVMTYPERGHLAQDESPGDAPSPHAASPHPASPHPASPHPASPHAASPNGSSPDAPSPDAAPPDASSSHAPSPDGGSLNPSSPSAASRVATRWEPTPNTVDTASEVAAEALDIAAGVGGIAAGLALIIGTKGLAAPLVVGCSTLWTSGRAAERLVDRAAHGQSLDPLESAAARAAWLELGGGLATAGTLGAAGAVARFGAQSSLLTRIGVTAARGSAVALDAAAAADAAHQLLSRWDQLDGGARVQLALSIGFWGVQAGVALRGRAARLLDTARTRGAVQSGDALPPSGVPRNTLGWSGTPGPVARAGQEHLPVIHRGTEHLERLAPGAQQRILALFDADPKYLKKQADLRDAQVELYREHAALMTTPESKLDAAGRSKRAEVLEKAQTLMKELDAADNAVRVQRKRRFHSATQRKRAAAEMERVLAGLKRLDRPAAAKLAAKVHIDSSVGRTGVTEAQLREWLTDFYEIAGDAVPPFKITLHFDDPRGRFDFTDGNLNIGKPPSKRVIFHEMGHALEYERRDVAKAASAWREARAEESGFGGQTRPLKELMPRGRFEADEFALQDHFASPYVGKVYHNGATEVVSTGMEHLVDAHALATLFVHDIEHFFLVLGATK